MSGPWQRSRWVVVTRAMLIGGGALPRWYWAGMQIGATTGVVFVHWLIFVSFYLISALCPYCTAVWMVTFLVFWYVTLCTTCPRDLIP